jgi:hypothetical protein
MLHNDCIAQHRLCRSERGLLYFYHGLLEVE